MITLLKYLDEMEGCEVRSLPLGILQGGGGLEFMEISFLMWTGTPPAIGQEITITDAIGGNSGVWKVHAINEAFGKVIVARPKMKP